METVDPIGADDGAVRLSDDAALAADTLFWDDFEAGNLEMWNVVNGEWDIIQEDGNRVARMTSGDAFGVINIKELAVRDFTMEVRLWQVSRDNGANIYFYNNRTASNIGEDVGYWFGISGALDAVGWGEIIGAEMNLYHGMDSSVPLDSTNS